MQEFEHINGQYSMPGLKLELPDIKLLKGGSAAGSKQSSAAPSPVPSVSSTKDELPDTPKTPKSDDKETKEAKEPPPKEPTEETATKENGKTEEETPKETEVKENGEVSEVSFAEELFHVCDVTALLLVAAFRVASF